MARGKSCCVNKRPGMSWTYLYNISHVQYSNMFNILAVCIKVFCDTEYTEINIAIFMWHNVTYTIPALVAFLVGHNGHDGHNDNKGQYHHHHNWNHNVNLVRIPCMYTHTCRKDVSMCTWRQFWIRKYSSENVINCMPPLLVFYEPHMIHLLSHMIPSTVSHDPSFCLTWSPLLSRMIPALLTAILTTYHYHNSSLAIYPLHSHSHYDFSWIWFQLLDYIARWYYPYWLTD